MEAAVKALKRNKAVVDGDYPAELLQKAIDRDPDKKTLQLLTALCNAWWIGGYFPKCLKTHQTTLAFKDGRDADAVDSWRKIAVQPTLAKLYHKAVQMRLSTYVNQVQILPLEMKGFVPAWRGGLRGADFLGQARSGEEGRCLRSCAGYGMCVRFH